MEDITLICGDCLEVLPTLADNSVNKIVIDLLYRAAFIDVDHLGSRFI